MSPASVIFKFVSSLNATTTPLVRMVATPNKVRSDIFWPCVMAFEVVSGANSVGRQQRKILLRSLGRSLRFQLRQARLQCLVLQLLEN